VAERRYDDLIADLTALGRVIDQSTAPRLTTQMTTELAAAVMDRVATLPVPAAAPERGSWTRRLSGSLESRRRRIAVAVVAVLLALLAAPPVRAAVADWFGFAGVLVERGSPSTDPAPPPPEVAAGQALSEAADLVDFTPSTPQSLGPPDGVEVSADRRVLSMSWSTADEGVLRLDQFDARLDFTMAKRAPGVQYARVGASAALWFEEPHEVVLLEADGSRRTESARLAGHTLIWQDGFTTLRLEGDLDLARAVEIANSATPID